MTLRGRRRRLARRIRRPARPTSSVRDAIRGGGPSDVRRRRQWIAQRTCCQQWTPPEWRRLQEEEEEGAGVCFEEAGPAVQTPCGPRRTPCCWGFGMTGPEADCSPNMCAWMMVLLPMVIFFYLWEDVLEESSRPAPCRERLLCLHNCVVPRYLLHRPWHHRSKPRPVGAPAAPATALSQGQGGRRHDAHRHVVLDLLDLPPAARVAPAATAATAFAISTTTAPSPATASVAATTCSSCSSSCRCPSPRGTPRELPTPREWPPPPRAGIERSGRRSTSS